MTLYIYPDSVLREKANPVNTYSKALPDFLNDMLVMMKKHKGIGLSAPQIGIFYRIIVADIGKGEVCLINPEIIASSGEDIMTEGCLSLPDQYFDIKRKFKIEVCARNGFGGEVHFDTDGLLARVLQHEIDHLNGILICDKGETIKNCDTDEKIM